MSAPMRPGDVRYDVPLARVAHLYSDHVLTLAQHRHNLITLTLSEVAEHALAALAYGGTLDRRVESGRWSTALDALTAGAGLERTAAAMDRDVSGLRVGLMLWASEQLQIGLVDVDRYGQVVRLIWEEPT